MNLGVGDTLIFRLQQVGTLNLPPNSHPKLLLSSGATVGILDAPAFVYSAYPGFPRSSHRKSLYLWVDWMVSHFPEDGVGEGAGNYRVSLPSILSVCQD